MIEFKNVTKIYYPKKGTKKLAIDNINFSLFDNGLIFLIGKSGSGKSTLLNLLGTLDKPTSGDILIDGKNISKFKESELTSYRSTHIGFIFQEFNLLDDLNVYDNIDLSLNSKKIKSKKEILDKYLDFVGLKGLGLRKIGELSGGEKQRLAIARALIKKPSIILADEPTGNLDSINSKQIFNLLKQISKNHLVIVVSHDRENAYNYADGIIEISDGKIINNTINFEENITEKVLKLNKYHISFFKRLKLSFGMVKKKKIRLSITILLLTVAFSLFGISHSLMNFDIPKTHAETMVYEGENNILLDKGKISEYRLYNMLTETEVNSIMNNLNSNYYQESYLYQNNKLAELKLGFNPKYADIHSTAYYSIYDDYLNFIIYNDEQLEKMEILGVVPTKANEVLITELLADYLVVYGFRSYDSKSKSDEKYYDDYVETKEDLIGKKIYVENGYIIISGIIVDEELEKYESLKEVPQNKMNKKPTVLFNEFVSVYKNNLYNIYIGNSFTSKTELSNNFIIDNSTFDNILYFNSEVYYDEMALKIFSESSEIYDGTRFKKVSKIEDDEIILSSTIVEWLSNGIIMEKFLEEGKKIKEEYLKKVEEREQKVKEQFETMQNDPNYIYVEIPEIKEPDYDMLIREIIIDFINDNNLIGKEITIEMIDEHHIYSAKDSVNHKFKIVGVTFEQAYSLLGNKMKNYTFNNIITASINIHEDNEKKLIEIFNNFDNKEYNMTTRFSSSMNSIAKIVSSLEKISNYISGGFMIFATILLTIFVTNNLNINKRKIGILRALGATISDVLQILVLENMLIGIFTFLLSLIGTTLGINILNAYITKELFFYARPVIFNIKSISSIIFVILFVMLVSFIFPTIKISKSKPIKLIQMSD